MSTVKVIVLAICITLGLPSKQMQSQENEILFGRQLMQALKGSNHRVPYSQYEISTLPKAIAEAVESLLYDIDGVSMQVDGIKTKNLPASAQKIAKIMRECAEIDGQWEVILRLFHLPRPRENDEEETYEDFLNRKSRAIGSLVRKAWVQGRAACKLLNDHAAQK